MRELTGGRGVDYAFEAIGLVQTIELAIRNRHVLEPARKAFHLSATRTLPF